MSVNEEGIRNMRALLVGFLLFFCVSVLGCSETAVEPNGPQLRGVSNHALVVGETVEFYFSGIEFERSQNYRLLLCWS